MDPVTGTLFASKALDYFLTSNGYPPILSWLSPPAPPLDMTPVLASLDQLRETDQGILDTLRAPTRTAGNEMLERAWNAYRRGWFDDAFQDGEASVQMYPYRAAAHLIVALSAIALRNPEKTIASLQLAVRYAVDSEMPIGASAALLLSDIIDAGGAPREAAAVLDAFDEQSDGVFAEVAVAAHLRIPDDTSRLRRALKALVSAGLDPSAVPNRLYGLSPEIDAALEEKTRWLTEVSNARKHVAETTTQLSMVLDEPFPTLEGRLSAYLLAVDGVDIPIVTRRFAQIVDAYTKDPDDRLQQAQAVADLVRIRMQAL